MPWSSQECYVPCFSENQWVVFRQIRTSIDITGTSMTTPITVPKAAPEESPQSMVAMAIAIAKWLEAPIMTDAAASSWVHCCLGIGL
jgi:hypothetical protein